ncbi:DUF1643 domain-containing protein [Telmatocola sphagniphila]|uniref:DUF1643 domain-containing protein n=1 Tax=Telmatocola sphagniphila TaxID=1123043 RepID=UPI0021BC59DD|nr:DUF1643 domain-containing protein [Telmatocola sphagniphila]
MTKAYEAKFSRCGHYRYALWRRWSAGSNLLFVMLNPSLADETVDDPTVRRCIGFARTWGFGSLSVANLFAFRTPHPSILKTHPQPVGRFNDRWLMELQQRADLVVAAWGNHGVHQGRAEKVRSLLKAPCILGLTKLGQPMHPLYAPGKTPWILWEDQQNRI